MEFTNKEIEEAKELWNNLHNLFLQAEETIRAIIAVKAWEPLGYETFASCWLAQMRNITVANEIRPYIIYQLFDENLTADQVANAVKGIGPEKAAAFKREKDNGVPATAATGRIIRREHEMKVPPEEQTHIHLEFTREEIVKWQKIATDKDLTLKEIATASVRSTFESLGD